jgi:hypothetical protein
MPASDSVDLGVPFRDQHGFNRSRHSRSRQKALTCTAAVGAKGYRTPALYTVVETSCQEAKAKECIGRESNPGLAEISEVRRLRMATANFTTKPPMLFHRRRCGSFAYKAVSKNREPAERKKAWSLVGGGQSSSTCVMGKAKLECQSKLELALLLIPS